MLTTSAENRADEFLAIAETSPAEATDDHADSRSFIAYDFRTPFVHGLSSLRMPPVDDV